MDDSSNNNIDIIIKENEFLKKLLKEIPATILINKIDEKGYNMPVWANDKYEKLFGYTLCERQEIGHANKKHRIYYKEDVEIVRKAIIAGIKDRSLEEAALFRIYNKNGELRWIFINSRATIYKGDPNHILSVCFDVTEKLVFNQKQHEIYIKEIAQLKNHIKNGQLTRIEKEIIKELVSGKSTKQIAEGRKRSYETINNHKRNIFNKLQINKLSELICFAIENGLN